MFELSPELTPKFKKFRDSYEWALVWLADAGGNAERKEHDAWVSAKCEVPLSDTEEVLFRKLINEEALTPNDASTPGVPGPIPRPNEPDGAIPRPDESDLG